MNTCMIAVNLLLLPFLASAAGAAQYYPPKVAEAIDAYMRERDSAVRAVGPVQLTNVARDLVRETDELAIAIQTRRKDDPEGTVFDAQTAAAVRTRVASLFSLKDGPEMRHLILDVQPASFAVAVNARYPGGEPRSSMPPSLLTALPTVPAELAYRFAGRHLLLLDRVTGVIVDVVRDALPLSGIAIDSHRPQ